MTPQEIASLEQEKRTNAGTITGLETRIKYSQDEIDALTRRNAEIDAALKPVAAAPSKKA